MSVELTFENAHAGRSLRDLHPLPGVFEVNPSATARQMLMQGRLSPLHTHLPTLTLPSYATDTGTMSHCNTLQHTATHCNTFFPTHPPANSVVTPIRTKRYVHPQKSAL